MKTSNTVAILMSVRDEESYLDFNISYHLDLGFDYIFIANHRSVDNTNKILDLDKTLFGEHFAAETNNFFSVIQSLLLTMLITI